MQLVSDQATAMTIIWPLLQAAFGFTLAVVGAWLLTFVSKLWQTRSHIRRLQKAGKPVPPHSFLMGHLLQAKAASEELPPGAHSAYVLTRLATKFKTEAFYFDPWPIADPLLSLTDYRLANQATSHEWTGSVKPPTLSRWFAPISGRGGLNLFTQNGADWKQDHEIFLPFFNNANLDATLPAIVEEMLVLRGILRQKSQQKDVVLLEPLMLALMNDVIGRVVFNAELKNQTSGSHHPLSKAMLRQLSLKFTENDVVASLTQLNPLWSLEVWYNGRVLDKQIRAQIEKRAAVFQAEKGSDDKSPSNAMLDRIIADYFSQSSHKQSGRIDEEFMTMLCAQMRLLFFAGYDSTSSTLTSMCYLIWRHPDVLAKLRAEHDEVFGRNTEACPAKIVENPSILNCLPYTNAVIKEVMRLFPPAAGVRQGCKELVLRGNDGMEYPTEGIIVQINHVAMMRNPATWPRPLEFLPERFLVGPEHELYPPKGAWRVFEMGRRDCTGQAFVMKELRMFLALFAREFDFKECYDEVYAGETVDLTHVYNEKAFLTESGSAHPRGNLPCRISLSHYASTSA
ncbi:cytochrome P450 [Xylaria bambusicola]|uniref:cytochrome P450 n=1 Tax=Xylaria bambusicola TaxID=326684 RepID=UPI0020083466|nr:cytochrome P450 [Xylaria bambusicola]KAI0517787.1 cytochrome P450 [Xylaria bambusicola]